MNNSSRSQNTSGPRQFDRTVVLYLLMIIVGALFIVRLFYLQVIRNDFYVAEGLKKQQLSYEIPAERGLIYARDGENKSPLVLNEALPTLLADQRIIVDPENTAKQIRKVIGGEYNQILDSLQGDSAYSVIAKELKPRQSERIEKLELVGISQIDETYRVYPEGGLAAQLLGFVNDDGFGQYGVEEALNEDLEGENGVLEAVADVNRIPLSTQEDNIIQAAQDGDEITLTIDINVQRQVEEDLKRGVQRSGAKSGAAIVMDPNSGAIIAMANFPSYEPAKFTDVEDFAVFQNAVVSDPYEVGSVIKGFTMAVGLQEGAVKPATTYYDPGFVQVEDRRIENAGASGGVTRSMNEVIQKSVNTGVIHVLSKLGGGSINEQARNTLHEYFTEVFGLGSKTGIAQANEASGTIIAPSEEEGNNVRYANMTFGQGMDVTMLQTIAGYSALVNGGDYYKPYLVSEVVTSEGDVRTSDPTILRKDIVSEKVSKQVKKMFELVVSLGGGNTAKRDGYKIGGKTGTSQVIDSATGEYSEFRENGSFVGYGASGTSKYVIMTRVIEPDIFGYAGSGAAAPIFADISDFLIDYYQIPPN